MAKESKMAKQPKQHDADLKNMTPVELRREVIKLRRGLRRWASHKNNERCWIEDDRLLSLLPEKPQRGIISLPTCKFLANCQKYARRNTLWGLVTVPGAKRTKKVKPKRAP